MSISRILHFEALGILYAFAAMLVYQMLVGRINVKGLISQKDGSNQTSPERIQLLLATLAASASYLGEMAKNTSLRMPDVDQRWIYLMGGSSAVYVFRKGWTTWKAAKSS